MKQRNRICKAGVIIFIMVFVSGLFTACGNGNSGDAGKKNETDAKTNIEKQGKGTDAGKEEDGYVYQVSFEEFGVKSTRFESMCTCSDRIYMIGTYSEENKKTGEYVTRDCLLSCALDGSDWTETELNLKKDEYIQKMAKKDEDTFFILTRVVSYDKKTQKNRTHTYIKVLGKDGSIKKDHDLQQGKEMKNLYIGGSNTMLAGDGSVYISDEEKSIYYFDKEGKQGKIFDMKRGADNIVQTADGSIYIYGNFGDDNNTCSLRKLDEEQQKFGEIIDIGEVSVFNSELYGAENGLIYLKGDDGMYCIDTEAERMEFLFNWINHNIDGQEVEVALPLSDGSIMAILVSYQGEKEETQLAIIKKVKASEAAEKTVLTLACTYLSGNLKEEILDFNRINENYRIEVQDYSSYSERNTKLNLAMVSGSVPDILSLNELPANMYMKKGLLTDLYPLIEEDPEIKKEDFLEPVIHTLEQDGKLPYLGASFYVEAWSGGKKYLKDTEGWNFDEMQEIYEKKKENEVFFDYIWREYLLRSMVLGQMKELINWNTGEVHMDTEDFCQLLEFTKQFPTDKEVDFSSVDMEKSSKQGKIILLEFGINSFSDVKLHSEFYRKEGGFTIVSYPSEDKKSTLGMRFANPPLAITEACKDKKGAWEFLRRMFTYDGQMSTVYDEYGGTYGFPVRKDVFEKILEYSMATESYTDHGIKVTPIDSSYSYNGYGVPIGPLNQEEAEQFRAAVDRIGELYMDGDIISNQVMDIVSEEAEAFYAGDKTAEEAAKIIQSRVKLMVSENS